MVRAMRSQDVTLGEGARRMCPRLGIAESDVRDARAGSISEHDSPEYLIVMGELPDGRSVRMMCRHDMPWHVVSFRPV
jgi:hypothetical protein